MDEQPAVAPVPPPASARHRRLVIVGSAVAAIVVLGGVVAFALMRDDDPQASANGSSPKVEGSTGPSSTGRGAGGPTTTKPKGSSATTRKPGSGGTGSPTTAKGGAQGSAGSPTTKGPGKSGGTTVPLTLPSKPVVPTDIETAYSDAYNARCAEIWSHAGPDGELWDAIDPDYGPFTITDCTSALDPFWGEALSDTVAEARLQGVADANETASSLVDSGRMRNTAGYIYDIPQ